MNQYPASASDTSLYTATAFPQCCLQCEEISMSCPNNSYEIGNTVEISVQFLDPDSAPIDPTTVTLRIKNPDGNTTINSSTTKTGTGAYEYIFVPTLAGNYFYRWEGTGNLSSAVEGQFLINSSNVTD